MKHVPTKHRRTTGYGSVVTGLGLVLCLLLFSTPTHSSAEAMPPEHKIIATAEDSSGPPAQSAGDASSAMRGPTGIPYSASLRITAAGRRFEIPVGYLNFWPTQKALDAPANESNLGLPGFSFWMPSGRFEPIKTTPPMVLLALSQRGAKWGPEEYTVVVVTATFANDETAKDLVLPEQMLSNIREQFRLTETSENAPRDLLRLVPEDTRLHEELYSSKPGASVDLLVDVRRRNVQIPGLNVFAFFRPEQLYLNFRAYPESLANVEAVISKIREKLTEWQSLPTKD